MKEILKFSSLTVIAVLFIAFSVKAQKVENVNVQISDEKAHITYDLTGAKENQDLEIKLYGTVKGYDMLLYRAKGDVGKYVKPGLGKTIEWNNDEELTSYNKKEMTFKVVVVQKQQYKAQKEAKSKSKGIFSVFAGMF